jgi:hypothetical protein
LKKIDDFAINALSEHYPVAGPVTAPLLQRVRIISPIIADSLAYEPGIRPEDVQ